MGALLGRGMQEVESGKFCEASGRALQGAASSTPRSVKLLYSPQPFCYSTGYCEIATLLRASQ